MESLAKSQLLLCPQEMRLPLNVQSKPIHSALAKLSIPHGAQWFSDGGFTGL